MAEILFVGPEEVFPRTLEECSQSLGHQPIRALGAGQALLVSEKAKRLLAFIDADSKQYEPLDLMGKILGRQESAVVVLTASQASVDLAVESIKEGAWDFLVRPVELEKFELLMEQALGSSQNDKEVLTADKSVSGGKGPWQIITNDSEFKKVLSIAERAASGQASVLIQGESGTGKEMLARFIHMHSPRKNKPFVAVNCAALPEALLESELFGHEKGAFTGAISRRLGKFEMAHGGTILLDEISEMQIHLQAKLLRVLQEQTVDRVGGSSPVHVDVRVIATTNRALPQYIEEGNFREDLFYRLNVIPLHIPPLRSRLGDISLLVTYFVKKHNKRNNKKIDSISNEVHEALSRCVWNGNVRELENVIERAVVLAHEDELLVEHLLLEEQPQYSLHQGEVGRDSNGIDSMVGLTVQEMERRLIMSTLGKVSENRTRAAEMLGISIRTLRNKLKEYEAKTPAT